jgi:hypothetical protein
MTREILAMPGDDTGHVGLERAVERGLDARRARLAGRGQHHLDEMRRGEGRGRRREGQPLVERVREVSGGQCAARSHAAQHRALPGAGRFGMAERVEAARPLRQAGEEGRLRRREHRRRHAEVGLTRPLGAGELIAVGGEVQVQREQFGLREAMFEAQRDERLVRLGRDAATPRRLLAVEQQLRDLLRDRGRTFDDAALGEVRTQRPQHRERIEAQVAVEPAILGSKRRGDEPRRQGVGGKSNGPCGLARQRLVDWRAMAIHDHRGRRGRCRQQRGGQRPAADPERQSHDCGAAGCERPPHTRPPRGDPRPKTRPLWRHLGHRATASRR